MLIYMNIYDTEIYSMHIFGFATFLSVWGLLWVATLTFGNHLGASNSHKIVPYPSMIYPFGAH